MMMEADLWGWFHRCLREAIAKGDLERQRLAYLHDQMWDTIETDTPASMNCVIEATTLARRLNEPCWWLFHEYWRSEILMFYIKDYPSGMENAVKTVMEARKPQYQHCPVLGRVYRMLFDAYLIMDPLGYEAEIYETIAYMENEIAMDNDTAHLLHERKAELCIEKGDLDAAYVQTLKYLEVSEFSAFRKSDAYLLLAYVLYHQQAFERALELAKEAEMWSHRAGRQTGSRNAIMWQAMLCQKLGQAEAAARHYRTGMVRANALSVHPSSIFYEAACTFQELVGTPEKALALRDAHLQNTLKTRGPHSITTARLKRARLLGRMGLADALKAEITEAHKAAQVLRKPQHYLSKLGQVEAGDYAERL